VRVERISLHSISTSYNKVQGGKAASGRVKSGGSVLREDKKKLANVE
jgi:hypothetical protein